MSHPNFSKQFQSIPSSDGGSTRHERNMECDTGGLGGELPQGDQIASQLEDTEVGTDEDGEAITTCVIVPAELSAVGASSEDRLTPNQQTMYRILHAAGPSGLRLEDWYDKARSQGIGTNRRATLGDLRAALHTKGLVIETMNGWASNNRRGE